MRENELENFEIKHLFKSETGKTVRHIDWTGDDYDDLRLIHLYCKWMENKLMKILKN